MMTSTALEAARDARSERSRRRFASMGGVSDTERLVLGNRVVEDHLELAEAIARRYRRGSEDYSDLRQVALMGLVKAARHYDPERGTPFVPYAVPTIAGEVKRHLRDHGWFVRPGRQLQELCIAVAAARGTLAQTLGREASDEELAETVGTTVQRVRDARACLAAQHPVAVDPAPDDEDGSPARELAAEPDTDPFERAEQRVMLQAALRCLDARERLIVLRRFVDERTQAEIGAELGVTQMQVSRLLGQILAKLRVELSDDETEHTPVLPHAA